MPWHYKPGMAGFEDHLAIRVKDLVVKATFKHSYYTPRPGLGSMFAAQSGRKGHLVEYWRRHVGRHWRAHRGSTPR